MSTSWSGQRRAFPSAMRAAILKRDKTCQCRGCGACTAYGCDRRSTEADHIHSHAECQRAGINPDQLSNGQGLCSQCHAIKTMLERQAGRQRLAPRRSRPHPSDSLRGGGVDPLPPAAPGT